MVSSRRLSSALEERDVFVFVIVYALMLSRRHWVLHMVPVRESDEHRYLPRMLSQFLPNLKRENCIASLNRSRIPRKSMTLADKGDQWKWSFATINTNVMLKIEYELWSSVFCPSSARWTDVVFVVNEVFVRFGEHASSSVTSLAATTDWNTGFDTRWLGAAPSKMNIRSFSTHLRDKLPCALGCAAGRLIWPWFCFDLIKPFVPCECRLSHPTFTEWFKKC